MVSVGENMSSNGYIQIKIRETNEKIDELNRKINTLEIKIGSYEKLISKLDALSTFGDELTTQTAQSVKIVFEEYYKKKLQEWNKQNKISFSAFRNDFQSMVDQLSEEIARVLLFHNVLHTLLVKKGYINEINYRNSVERLKESTGKRLTKELKKSNTVRGKMIKPKFYKIFCDCGTNPINQLTHDSKGFPILSNDQHKFFDGLIKSGKCKVCGGNLRLVEGEKI